MATPQPPKTPERRVENAMADLTLAPRKMKHGPRLTEFLHDPSGDVKYEGHLSDYRVCRYNFDKNKREVGHPTPHSRSPRPPEAPEASTNLLRLKRLKRPGDGRVMSRKPNSNQVHPPPRCRLRSSFPGSGRCLEGTPGSIGPRGPEIRSPKVRKRQNLTRCNSVVSWPNSSKFGSEVELWEGYRTPPVPSLCVPGAGKYTPKLTRYNSGIPGGSSAGPVSFSRPHPPLPLYPVWLSYKLKTKLGGPFLHPPMPNPMRRRLEAVGSLINKISIHKKGKSYSP
ncbi:hypothetical protein Q8A67_016861 [Cirrhinus molitorella]|uniref:Uncharacterized protein n=1 Tax=Cirrhinus molitorella TaxID=172907 RepID=A0AA88TSX9_9TELE|nr:hypothetical protein Q8A67_016861 [Cirrhinus molitorella]